MARNDAQNDVPPPAARLLQTLALWGGGAALIALSVAWSRGSADSAAMAVASVAAASAAGAGLLVSMKPRPLGQWAFPIMLSQIVRTMLAPAIGLAVFLLIGSDPVAFWLSLLGVAVAMLVGESIAIARWFGSATPGRAGLAGAGEVAA